MAALQDRWNGQEGPFLITPSGEMGINDVLTQDASHLTAIKAGDVVALVGDFDPSSIADLLVLFDRRAVVVPLTNQTRGDHEYFMESALVDWVIEGREVRRRNHGDQHPLLAELRNRDHPGLVLFSTGTTGRPKAILHDMSNLLRKFETPRPALRTLAFLLFDHIGGINTLLHTMFNAGVVVTPENRSVKGILETCGKYDVEALPTTPTFLRMMLISGLIPQAMPASIRIITYGTERMDQTTLSALCELLPNVDFRQTFGMSELGILRVKSKSRDSLFMRIGGEGVRTRVDDHVLKIWSPDRMLGYLNAESPFDSDGWYDTKDVVESEGDFIKVVGRTSEQINVGGLKFMASEVERVAMQYPGISLVSVKPRENPVTGQHIELTIETVDGGVVDIESLRAFLGEHLPAHMQPRRISAAKVDVSHRFKRS